MVHHRLHNVCIIAIAIIGIICMSGSNGGNGNGVMAWPEFGPGTELHLNTSDFNIDCIGRCPYDIVKTLQHGPAYVLMGGAVDASTGLQSMVTLADGGDFLILRMADSGPLPLDRYNQIVYAMEPRPNSVTTISMWTMAATRHNYLLTRLADAEAIFFTGGNVFEYYSTMVAGPMQAGIKNATTTAGAILGGNGEGMALLCEYVSTDQYGPVTSNQAMAAPMDERVSLGWKFVENQLVSHVMAEPYMVSKDRMGKLITVIARVIHSNWASYQQVRGLGIDDEATVVINATGWATAIGSGSVYFVRGSQDPEIIDEGASLTWSRVEAQRLDVRPTPVTWLFHSWKVPTATAFKLDVSSGQIAQENRYGPEGPLPGPPGSRYNSANRQSHSNADSHDFIAMATPLTESATPVPSLLP